MSDIYSSPNAELARPVSGSQFGSLENGIAGNYQLTLGGALSDAWGLVKGAKGSIWLAFLIYIGVYFGAAFGAGFLGGMLGAMGLDPTLVAILTQLLVIALTAPLGMGLFLVGLHRAANRAVRPSTVLSQYSKLVPIVLTSLLMYLMVIIGLCLLILPGIYLAIAYTLSLPLVAEKNLSGWQALEASRKALTPKWFTVFGIWIVVGLAISLSAIPLGIGLIWTLPWSIILGGVIYRQVFGVEQSTLAAE